MIKRQGFKTVFHEPFHSRIKRGLCPMCAKPKHQWERRKDWKCCSTECTAKWHKYGYTSYTWQGVRDQALKRDNFTCVWCGDNRLTVEVKTKFKQPTNTEDYLAGKAGKIIYKDCYYTNTVNNLIGDHIKPIALGGDEFDLNNVQTLCLACNKIKTANDARDIAIARRTKNDQKLFQN